MKFLLQTIYGWYRQLIRHPRARWWVVLATIAYLVVPTDFAPDFLPFLGQIDDAALVTMLVAELSPMVVEQLKKRKQKDSPATVS
ncbi:MAG TPA: DUF1232 domain-containing protein [Synechococcales cyanobacterium M55_K2018_004]|nr:DUF1232 domain-containing protein [Synechococcales cyanobacterium M55_K2018_004]